MSVVLTWSILFVFGFGCFYRTNDLCILNGNILFVVYQKGNFGILQWMIWLMIMMIMTDKNDNSDRQKMISASMALYSLNIDGHNDQLNDWYNDGQYDKGIYCL